MGDIGTIGKNQRRIVGKGVGKGMAEGMRGKVSSEETGSQVE